MPKKPKNKKADATPSVVVVAMRLRNGQGVHQDQRTRKDPKAIRRDKSYKGDE